MQNEVNRCRLTRRNIGCKYSKLQDEIDDARTEVQKIVYEAQLFSTKEMIRVIKEQPTAFNVEKVVVQLEAQSKMNLKKGLIEVLPDEARPYLKAVESFDKGIEIIKAGGIDE